jgi:hypothetical protein
MNCVLYKCKICNKLLITYNKLQKHLYRDTSVPKLERYREVKHGQCLRITRKIVKPSTLKKTRINVKFYYPTLDDGNVAQNTSKVTTHFNIPQLLKSVIFTPDH